MRTQKAKRATKRWLEGAPDYVLACFDHPQFADRYTIVFGGTMQEHTHGKDWLHYLGTSESGHVSGSGEFSVYEFATYRYANAKRKIKWRDLPLGVRLRVRYWAEEGETPLTHAQILKIGAEENSLLDRLAA